MKKIIVSFLILFMTFSTLVLANNSYPLENDEKILETRKISEDKVEIFTSLDNNYYRKTLEKQDEKWTVVQKEIAEVPLMGLKEDDNIEKDHSIEKALENKLKASGYNLKALPSKLDLSETGYLPPVGKQHEDSCVGWSTGYYLRTYQQARDIGWDVGNNPRHIFSPSFIYNQINGGRDRGATFDDAGNLLKNIGAATIYDFPYVIGDYLTQPSSTTIEKASTHKIRDWYVLYTKSDSKEYIINKTKEYLNTGDLPVAGIGVGFKWAYPLIEPDGTSIVTTEEYILGGHAVVVVGYDDNIETPEGHGAFKIVNSYGEEWGQNGYTYMTYDAFASAIRLGYVFTDLVNGRIVDEMEDVNTILLDDDTVKFYWNKTLNASGYRVLDENFNVLSNIYNNQYTEKLQGKTNIKRYFQAFNSISTSNVVLGEINLNSAIKDTVPVEINDIVEFQMNFSGNGRYDIRIKDSLGNIIKEDTDKKGTHGVNTLTWDGKDSLGSIVEDGKYKLELITYKGTEAKTPFAIDFEKKSRVESASAKSYKIDGKTYKVEVEVTAKVSGKISVYALKGDSEELIISNDAINSGESKMYKIDSSKIDLNDKDLSVKVVVD